jgi:hypothetical protein
LAETCGRTLVTKVDIQSVDDLFLDGRASARRLQDRDANNDIKNSTNSNNLATLGFLDSKTQPNLNSCFENPLGSVYMQ